MYKIIYVRGIPWILTMNNLILLYADSRTRNTGDSFWYTLAVMVNLAFLIVDAINRVNDRR